MIRPRKKFSLKFVAKPTKSGDGKDVIIYCRLIAMRVKSEWSLGLLGADSDWQEDTQRFSEQLQYNCKLNRQIQETEERLDECYRIIEAKGIRPTAKFMRDEFMGIEDTRNQPKLTVFLDSHIDMLRRLPEEEFSPASLIHYTAMRKRLIAFLKSIGEEHLLLKDLNRKHIVEFEEFLITTPSPETGRAIKRSSAGKYLSKIRVLVNSAIRKNLVQIDPFLGVKITRAAAKVQPLSWEEIELIRNSDLGGNKSLQKVRDIFCWSIFTGMRFSEAMAIRKTDVRLENGRYRMLIRSKKSKEIFDRPLISEATDLYHHLCSTYSEGEFLLPRCSNQKTNTYLSVIKDLLNLPRLHHHLGRHSFATTVLMDRGTDMKFVSHMLCHKKLSTTEQTYAKVTRNLENKVVDEINEDADIRLRKVS